MTKVKVSEINTKTAVRNDGQSCLCVSLNSKLKKKSCLKPITTTLFGFPVYIWTFTCFFIIAAVITITVLTYYLMVPKSLSSYYGACSANKDCNTTIGLHCTSQDNECSCPAKNTKGRCDCSAGTYWNGYKCTLLTQYNQSCSWDYNCDQSKDLKCINKTCSCVAPRYWNATSGYCDFIYIGCFIDNINSFQWSFRAPFGQRMFYFVDMCVDMCYRSNRKYAGITISTNNLCACFNTIITSSPISCDIMCYGTNGRYYPCGYTNPPNTNYRAYYQVF